jgi:hypothetical protein
MFNFDMVAQQRAANAFSRLGFYYRPLRAEVIIG